MTARDARIRLAAVADAEGISRCHVGGRQVHYRGILRETLLDAIDFEKRLARRRRRLTPGAVPMSGDAWLNSTDWVLEEGDAIRGWTSVAASRDVDLSD